MKAKRSYTRRRDGKAWVLLHTDNGKPARKDRCVGQSGRPGTEMRLFPRRFSTTKPKRVACLYGCANGWFLRSA